MKRFCLLLLFFPSWIFAQVNYLSVSSKVLQEDRNIKIQLPRNYDNDSLKSYPVIIVLDGDYLFEPVAGDVDYYSYWEEIPPAIVVGVMQNKTRQQDVMYDPSSHLPAGDSGKFFEFLGGELLPKIKKNYRTTSFAMLVGMDLTANFINYYLLKKHFLFHGFINISPDYAPQMHQWIINALSKTKNEVWYYLATGSADIPKLRSDILAFNKSMKKIDNSHVHYSFDDFKESTHYSLPGNAIPRGLETTFKLFAPISKAAIDSLVKRKGDPYDFLVNRYKKIKEVYGLPTTTKPIDYLTIAKAVVRLQDWHAFKKLGRRARKEYPHKNIGYYLKAQFYEGVGRYQKAYEVYREAYQYQASPGISRKYITHKMDQMKTKF